MFSSRPSYSTLQILKQDEHTLSDKFFTLELPNLKDGPSNAHLFIAQKEALAKKDSHNNFSASPESMEFSSINAFGVASCVMNMYDEDMKYLETHYQGKSKNFYASLDAWKTRSSIGIIPRKPNPTNEGVAYYTRTSTGGQLNFFSIYDTRKKLLHTSHCFDVIAHEMGHAILDILRPDLKENARPQTKGLHEAWGDITAMFTLLWVPVIRDDVLKATKNDLRNKSFFSRIGEDLSDIGGLREADNHILLKGTDCEEHELSKVFTGAIYEILANGFESFKLLNRQRSPNDLLKCFQQDLRRIILRAFIEVPYSNPSFSDVARIIKEIADAGNFRCLLEHIKKAFNDRGINIIKPHDEDDWCDLEKPPKDSSASGLRCGTLKHLWSSKVKEDSFNDDLSKEFKVLGVGRVQSPSRQDYPKPKDWF